ncbi:MAG: magnesium transporter CorA family protein [Pseudomonadales bacterium]|nr:magnesium transporter CorA family protein [Pseudomonadales bacterium]
MIRYFLKNRNDKILRVIDSPKVGSWISVENPSEKELIDLSEKFNLEADICLDALDPFEVPRIENEEGNNYIFTRFAHKSEDKIVTSPILFIITSKFLITISLEQLPFMTRFINNKIEFLTTQKTKFLIQMFFEIHRDYQRLVNAIHKDIRNLSTDLENINNKDISKFVRFETIFNDFLFGLEPALITLKKLMTGKFVKLFEGDLGLVEELLVDNEQLVAICKSNLKGIVNIRESHSSILNSNLNKTMKLLTALTAILTIPTMIFSFYGMNVALPTQHNPLAFLGIIIFTLIISLGIMTYFIKSDLL